VQVVGKIAAISIDKAVKSGIVWEHSIGSAEVVNSTSIQLQGSAPSYAIDKSSGKARAVMILLFYKLIAVKVFRCFLPPPMLLRAKSLLLLLMQVSCMLSFEICNHD
jgi:hypothetical protein